MITCAQIDSKQAYIVKIRNVWLFFSYNTLVCIKYNRYKDTPVIYETSKYHSRTTIGHISEFYKKYSKEVLIKDMNIVDNIDMVANQLLFESTKEMAVAYISE